MLNCRSLTVWSIEYKSNCGYGTQKILSEIGASVEDVVEAYEDHWKQLGHKITLIQKFDTNLYFGK